MKKAFGFPLFHSRTEFGDIVYGEVYTEDGKRLGHWTSSSLDWLKLDLSKHAQDYEYEFLNSPPSAIMAQLDLSKKHLP